MASLDSKSKAMQEQNKLKKMQFDAYVDKVNVNGKRFYRVKIGPIATKKKAVQILQELQDNKYEESYLTKE